MEKEKNNMNPKNYAKENDREVAEITKNEKENNMVVDLESADCHEKTPSTSLSVSEKEDRTCIRR